MSPGEAKPNSAEDMTLARQAASGDAGAFRMLVDRHSPGLFRLCCSLTATRTDAEDLLQETFVGAHGSLKRFNGSSSVKTWLTSILMRQAAKAWHRNRHHRRTRSIDSPIGSSQSNSHWNSQPNGAGTNPNPSTIASFATPTGSGSAASGPTVQRQSDLQSDLQAVLLKIEPMYREILVLREIQQMTYDEIAQSLNVPRGTVESRLFRARAELRRRLKGYGPE